jgi:glycerophosphoryl diester phosphodiesterase
MGMLEFEDSAFPLVVAHRGASSSYPENTLASFGAAIDAGAQVVELDVRLTADGVPIVLHDAEVSRCTDGRGFVHEMTVEQVKRLDASGGNGPKAEVPTLREVLDFVRDRAGIDLEIKNIPGEPSFDSPEEAILLATLRELHDSGFDAVIMSSFNWLTIERSRELAPELPTGFLTVGAIEARAALVYAKGAGHPWILPQVDAVLRAGPGLMDEAHRAGVRVGTWVADDAETLEQLFATGIDAVATNDPETALELRAAAVGRR